MKTDMVPWSKGWAEQASDKAPCGSSVAAGVVSVRDFESVLLAEVLLPMK